ncbi:hypothetical protein GCM10007423_00770 [Dyadobacter endophyticus]|uniref:Uncharacterized protein n=1 Tax=Dyadobacter endophyticus TaxID=1749036 RepID=A0ABQ1YD80_9BACT|nr:hypothetical protein GCM10007423_00770 [Dyadobacter endophyticus]
MSVDVAKGVISHIQADFADGRDSQYLPRLASVLQDRLMRNHMRLTDLMADAGYSNGYNYQFLEKRKITGWIPVFGKLSQETRKDVDLHVSHFIDAAEDLQEQKDNESPRGSNQ